MSLIPKTIVLATGLALALASTATMAQTVKLRFGSHLSPKAPGVVEGSDVFIKHAKELSNGTLDFEFYPSEQAGKALQMFDLVKSGAVDIGTIATGYVSSDKLPFVGLMEIPGVAKSVCGVTSAMLKMGAPGGIVYESDYKPNGIRILAIDPYPPYGPAASRTPITKVEDLKGMKMRNAGGLMELMVQKVGGVPVKMPSTEVFQSLQRGTLDTVLFSFLSVKSYSLVDVAKYGTTGYSWGTPGDVFMISERKFQALTKDQQNALVEAGRISSENWCKFVDKQEDAYKAEMRAAGMNIYTWSAADVAKMDELTADIPRDWAKNLDSRGKPATKALQEFKALAAK
jgi:TRAP-type C4-dicarboxylate transport system substrate-binding protein